MPRDADLTILVRADTSKAITDLRSFQAVARAINDAEQSRLASSAAVSSRTLGAVEQEKRRLLTQTDALQSSQNTRRLTALSRLEQAELKSVALVSRARTEQIRLENQQEDQLERDRQRRASSRAALLTGAKTVGGTLTASVSAPLVSLGTYSVKKAIDFDEAYTEVKKFAGGSAQEIEGLRKQLRSMAVDAKVGQTFEELSHVAAMGGQLGVATKDLAEFTRQVAYLGKAGDISGEEGATGLAKIAAAMKLPLSEIGHMTSALAEMGNLGSSSVQEILQISQRLASTGRQVGLTAPQVFAYANAVASLGQNAEAGGTALQRLFSKLDQAVHDNGKALNLYAAVAGVSARQFADAYGKSAAGAMQMFLAGLDKLPPKSGEVQKVMGALEIKEIRLRTALLNLASGHELVVDAMQHAETAYHGHNVAEEKAATASKSYASQLKQLHREMDDAAATLGEDLIPALRDGLKATEPLRDTVKSLAKQFHDLSPEAKTSVINIGLIASVAGPTILAISKIAEALGALRAAYLALKAAQAAGTLLPALGAGAMTVGGLGIVAAGAAGVGYLGYGIAQANMEADDARQKEMALPGWQQMRQEAGTADDQIKALRTWQQGRKGNRQGNVSYQELSEALRAADLGLNSDPAEVERGIARLAKQRDRLNSAAMQGIETAQRGVLMARINSNPADDEGMVGDEILGMRTPTGDGSSNPGIDAIHAAEAAMGGKKKTARAHKPKKTQAEIDKEKAARKAAAYQKWRNENERDAAVERFNREQDAAENEYGDNYDVLESMSKMYNVTPQQLGDAKDNADFLAGLLSAREQDKAGQAYRSAGGGIITRADGSTYEMNPKAWEELQTAIQKSQHDLTERLKKNAAVLTKRKEWLAGEENDATKRLAEAKKDWAESVGEYVAKDLGNWAAYGNEGQSAVEARQRRYQDAIEQGGLNLFRAARTGKQGDFQDGSNQFDQARAAGGASSIEANLSAIQAALSAPGSQLGKGPVAPLVLRRLGELRGDALATHQDELVLRVDDAIAQFQTGMKSAGQVFAENAVERLSANAKGILTDLLTGKPGDVRDKIKGFGKDLLGGIVGDVGDSMAERFNRSVKAKLTKAFLDGKAGFGDLFKGAEASAARIAAIGYGLLKAMMTIGKGGKQGTLGFIGGILGAGIALATGNPQFAIPAFSVGSNLLSGRPTDALVTAVGTAFDAHGAKFGGISSNPANNSYTYNTDGTTTVGPLGRSVAGGDMRPIIFQYTHQGDNYDRLDREREHQDFMDQARAVLQFG